MKKNKYIYILFASALVFGACSSDDALEKKQPGLQAGEALTFEGSVDQGLQILDDEDLDGGSSKSNVKSRVAINSDFQVTTWFTNDKISVSDGALSYTYSPDAETTGQNCTFTAGGNEFTSDGSGDEGTFYAFYPAEAVQSWNGNTVTSMIWTEQDYTENLEGSGVLGAYVAAKATTTDGGANAHFSFGHICSVIDIDLSSFTGGTVDAVAIYSNDKNSLAGRIKYNMDTKAITVVNNDGAGYAATNCISDLVTVSGVNQATPVVRFYVLPINLPNGITITVRTTDGKFYTKKSTAEVGKSAINTDYISGISNQTGNACLPYYKKYKFGNISTAKENLWMAMIPDNLRLRQLTMPGAHNAATSGVSGSASKCQSETIAQQLANGVRGFDLRPRYTSNSSITADNLLICHGLTTTDVLFKDAVADLVAFVQENPTEVVFINMQKEKTSSTATDRSSEWRTAVRTILGNNSSYLLPYLDTYQNFGDARGKIVVISKNPYGNENVYSDVVYGGIIQNTLDDESTTGAYIYKVGGGTIADASWEDHYGTTNTSTKKGYVQTMLEAAAGDTSPRFYFTWNNIAYSFGSGNPSDFAATMNPWLTGYINNNAPAERLGYIYGDFVGSQSYGGAALLKAIINHNYKYVYKGRTRRASASATGTGANVAGDEYADDSEVFVKRR